MTQTAFDRHLQRASRTVASWPAWKREMLLFPNRKVAEMPKLKPTRGRVLVRQHETETESPGGIVLPDKSQEKSKLATVLAVGAPKLLEDGTEVPVEISKGDVVLMAAGDYTGVKVDHEGEEFKIVPVDELFAWIPKADL